MSRPANCLELFRAVVQVSDEDVLQVPDLVIEPGEVVTVEACYEAATRLVDFLAGRGRGLLDRGWVDLDGHPLLALAPEERLRHGLHAPPLRPDSLRDIGALERLLGEVNQARECLELAPLPRLSAIMRSGIEPPLGPGHRRPASPDDDFLSALVQVHLVGAPLGVLALPQELGPEARRLLAVTLAEVRGQQRALLLLGPADDLGGLLGKVHHAGPIPPTIAPGDQVAC